MSDDLVAMARLAQRDERMSTGALYGDLADRIEELEAKLAKVISLADAMAEAIEDQIDTCDASMDEQAAVKNYRTTLAELTGGKDE